MSYNYLDKEGTSYDIGKTKAIINGDKASLQQRIVTMQTKLNQLEAQLNELETNIDWKEAVDTYADIATTYPNPQNGWTVNVKDTDYTYRYNGTAWVVISANAIPDATPFVKGLMTTDQVTKLNALENYVLPIAKTNELGGIKPDGITITVNSLTGVAVAKGEDKYVSTLLDTDINNPQDGEILTWDSSKNKWVNSEGGETVIRLADVSGATATQVSGTESVELTWSDPQDIEVGNIKLAEWKGTKVIRKENSAPTHIGDGDVIVDSLVRNQYSSTALVDSTVEFGKTYYYRFFPYTIGGVITSGSSRSVTIARTQVAIPQQLAPLTYDGTTQTPVFTNMNNFTFISGVASAVDAGTYEEVARLDSGYEWSDGTVEDKTISWSIQKATENIILSSETATLDEDHLTVAITVSNLQGRSISAVSDDTTVATVSVENGTVTIQHVNQTSGTATVTVTADATQNYNSSTDDIAVTATFNVVPDLNDATWAEINAAALDGTASSLWNVGDKKEIILNGTFTTNTTFSNLPIYAFIIGFNHNSVLEGNNTITFQLGYDRNNHRVSVCKDENVVMFTTSADTSVHSVGNGWEDSYMRNTLLSSFKNCLPSDLRSILKNVTKYTDNVGEIYPSSGHTSDEIDYEAHVTATSESIFILSEYEYFGVCTNANEYEQYKQAQYDYYANGNMPVFEEYNFIIQPSVATLADLETTYPNPQPNWTVYVDEVSAYRRWAKNYNDQWAWLNAGNLTYQYFYYSWTRSVEGHPNTWYPDLAAFYASVNVGKIDDYIINSGVRERNLHSPISAFNPAFVVGKS